MAGSTRLVHIEIAQTGEAFDCSTEEAVLTGMRRMGKRGIPVGCTNGGCGVCKIRVLDGDVRVLGPISAAQVDAAERACGYTLACRVAPVGPIRLEVCQKLRKPFALGKVNVGSPAAPGSLRGDETWAY